VIRWAYQNFGEVKNSATVKVLSFNKTDVLCMT